MKCTICEKTMQAAMFPTIFRCLAAQYPDFDLAGVRRTPDIASFN